jgi:hypothetical protein
LEKRLAPGGGEAHAHLEAIFMRRTLLIALLAALAGFLALATSANAGKPPAPAITLVTVYSDGPIAPSCTFHYSVTRIGKVTGKSKQLNWAAYYPAGGGVWAQWGGSYQALTSSLITNGYMYISASDMTSYSSWRFNFVLSNAKGPVGSDVFTSPFSVSGVCPPASSTPISTFSAS